MNKNELKKELRAYILENEGKPLHDLFAGTEIESIFLDFALLQIKNLNIHDVSKSVYVKCGCGGNLIPTDDGLVCDICG